MDRPLLAPIRIASASLNFFRNRVPINHIRSLLFILWLLRWISFYEGSQSFRQISLQIQAASPQMLWLMSCLLIGHGERRCFWAVSSQKRQFDDTGCHLTTPSSNSDFCQTDPLSSVAGIYGSGRLSCQKRSLKEVYHLVPRAPAPVRNPGNEEQPSGRRTPAKGNQSVPPVHGFPQYHPGRADCIGSS